MRTGSETNKRRGSAAANRLIGDYDTVRPLLRHISYGCYHKSFLVERLGQSARAYEENMARLRFFLPEGSLQSSRQGRREVYRFEGDSYRIADNFLAFQCLTCLEERREMTFSYGEGAQKLRVVPLRLVSDMYTGRRYVLAARLPAKGGRRIQGSQMFRLDLMQKVRTGKAWVGELPPFAAKEHDLRFERRREARQRLACESMFAWGLQQKRAGRLFFYCRGIAGIPCRGGAAYSII